MKSILIYSGGMDSTVLLYYLLARGDDVKCLSVDYGQRHRKELGCAKQVCAKLGVEHRVADLSALRPFLAGSSQTDDSVPVPHGHYAAENMKLTVVPNRNMMMLSVATAWAVSDKAGAVAYGCHAGDHAIYPDCRPEFTDAMERAMLLCDFAPVRLDRPFVHIHKGQICKLGASLGVPFELTWTCYEGGEKPCGKCGSCAERREAFAFAGALDPLLI